MKQYVQCRLERGDSVVTAWIEERGAKVGAEVELLPERDLWVVREVFADAPMPEDQLRETQRQRRGGLPSVGQRR